jgi:hypothetical protein
MVDEMDRIEILRERLADRRGQRVIFLSHCLLNENTRYLGGACRVACVREVVERCMDRGIGIVQMPCPEQLAWGGVLKRSMLRAYGMRGTALDRLQPVLLRLFVLHTRRMYRRLARQVAEQIRDLNPRRAGPRLEPWGERRLEHLCYTLVVRLDKDLLLGSGIRTVGGDTAFRRERSGLPHA